MELSSDEYTAKNEEKVRDKRSSFKDRGNMATSQGAEVGKQMSDQSFLFKDHNIARPVDSNIRRQMSNKSLSLRERGNAQITFRESTRQILKPWFYPNKATLVSLIVSPMLMISLILWRHHKTESLVCLSKDCIEYSGLLAKSIKSEIDPCDDFYDYACGNYFAPDPKKEMMFEQMYLKMMNRRRSKLILQCQVMKRLKYTRTESDFLFLSSSVFISSLDTVFR